MKPEKAFSLALLACLILLPLCIGGQTPTRTQADFVCIVQEDVPTCVRWSDVSLTRYFPDGQESAWEIHVKGVAEPLILKDADAYPEIAARLKDRH